MHDLGKIAVDDAVLRKPGRFTPEEFEIMKTHAKEGQRIVHQILEGTDDKYFQQIAENVAHYHHERMDGSGYPDKLKGEEIPLEARIMAIADVYDAGFEPYTFTSNGNICSYSIMNGWKDNNMLSAAFLRCFGTGTGR